KPHQRDIVKEAVRKGCYAIFAAFGLGKSIIQVEIARLIVKKIFEHDGYAWHRESCGKFLITCPLSVRQEFIRDGMLDTDEWRGRAEELGLDHAETLAQFGVRFKFIKSNAEID